MSPRATLHVGMSIRLRLLLWLPVKCSTCVPSRHSQTLSNRGRRLTGKNKHRISQISEVPGVTAVTGVTGAAALRRSATTITSRDAPKIPSPYQHRKHDNQLTSEAKRLSGSGECEAAGGARRDIQNYSSLMAPQIPVRGQLVSSLRMIWTGTHMRGLKTFSHRLFLPLHQLFLPLHHMFLPLHQLFLALHRVFLQQLARLDTLPLSHLRRNLMIQMIMSTLQSDPLVRGSCMRGTRRKMCGPPCH